MTKPTKASRIASNSAALKTTAALKKPRHFLDVKDLDAATLRRLIDDAAAEKALALKAAADKRAAAE